MEDDTLKYKIAISLIPGIGPILAKNIIAFTGSVESVFKENNSTLLKIPGIGPSLAKEINNKTSLKRAEQELAFISKYNIKPLFYLDKDYPTRLKHCIDGPIIIYAKGNSDLNKKKVLSIVGTRQSTQYGKDICNKLISDLSAKNHDVIIVSGLAYGIDVCAHKAALKNNLDTIAVLGSGLDTIYPSLHKSVANDIINQGALITEFLSNSQIERTNFLKRNRIIAGLSDATIIIESGIKGGSLVTGDIANSYNRDVFAFPGRINDNFSKGCNKLIKTNKASLVENVEDIEYLLGWNSPQNKPDKQKKLFIELSDDENQVVELLKNKGQLDLDIISLETHFPISKVSNILLQLEFSGVVKSLPGKVYMLS